MRAVRVVGAGDISCSSEPGAFFDCPFAPSPFPPFQPLIDPTTISLTPNERAGWDASTCLDCNSTRFGANCTQDTTCSVHGIAHHGGRYKSRACASCATLWAGSDCTTPVLPFVLVPCVVVSVALALLYRRALRRRMVDREEEVMSLLASKVCCGRECGRECGCECGRESGCESECECVIM